MARKYEVVGNHTVAGVAPGGVVELPDEQAAQLIAGGHVRPKTTAKRKTSDGDG